MKNKKLRREITFLFYEGVALDGNLVFSATCADRKKTVMHEVKVSNQMGEMLDFQQAFVKTISIQMKVIPYLGGVLEVLIAPENDIATVTATIAGIFSRESNFVGLDFLILHYRGTSVKVSKTAGRKSIVAMIMKALSQNQSIQAAAVDFTLQTIPNDAKKLELVGIPAWYLTRKVLQFRDSTTRNSLYLSEIKDGVITPDFTVGSEIREIIEGMKKLFTPVSNLYGIKGVELQMNHFEYRMDKDSDVGKIWHLFRRAIGFDTALSFAKIEEVFEQQKTN